MRKSIFMLVAVIAMVMAGCKETPYINNPGVNNEGIPDTVTVLYPDTNGIEISVDSAIAICMALPDGGTTSEIYKLRGMVVGNSTHPYDIPAKRDINFSISDNECASNISCYYTKNLNNRRFQNGKEVPLAGSRLTVVGVLTKYVSASSGKVTPELKDGFIVSIDTMVSESFKGCPEPKDGELSVNQAIQLLENIENKATSTETYKIRGVVVTRDLPTPSDLQQHGNLTFSISSDGGSYATCYRLKHKNGMFTAYNQLELGDTVVVQAKIQNFNGICEPTQGNVIESSNPNF